MDKNYYYRVLGVKKDATTQQIKKAYDDRIARLNSADYADDAAYVKKKKMQAAEAYRVLTGESRPVSKEQHEARFEMFKDHLENKEGFKKEKQPADGDFDNKCKNVAVKIFPDLNGTIKKAENIKPGTVMTLVIVGVVVLSVISSIIMEFTNEPYAHVQDDYIYGEKIEQALEDCYVLPYYSMLDLSTREAAQKDVVLSESAYDYDDEEMSDAIFDILWNLDVYDTNEFFGYTLGNEHFYDENSNYVCAQNLISGIGAPDFEEIAGATNQYDDELILTMNDYLDYLEEYIYENA